MEALETATNQLHVIAPGLAYFVIEPQAAPDNPEDIRALPYNPYNIIRQIVSETDWQWDPTQAIRRPNGDLVEVFFRDE